MGDLVEAEIAGTVGLLPGLTLMPMYTYTHKFQDHFRGERGFNYGQLQTQTDTDLHTLELRLAYSTALLVAQQRFPVPLSLSLRYIDRFAGTNNRLVIRLLGDPPPARGEDVDAPASCWTILGACATHQGAPATERRAADTETALSGATPGA